MPHWDEHADVVIVGSGIAGLSAAIEARQAGASVIVLEKMKITGGNTRISDGGVAAANNFLQKKNGIKDSIKLFYDDIMKAGLNLNHPNLVKIMAERASEAIEWTRSTLKIRYLDRLDRFGGHSVARCLTTINHTGADFIRAASTLLKPLGVEIRIGCLLTQLHTDDQGGVQGVQICSNYQFPDESKENVMNIGASRAVVLATGGFGNDISFRMQQNPVLDEAVNSTNHQGATAEGLIAALKVNAAPVHLSWIQLGPWGCADEKGYGRGASFASYSVYPNGILIDPVTGKRIVNEWADRRQRSEAIFKTGHKCIGIVDAKGAERSNESLQKCLKRGYVKAFDSLTELAAAFAMPVDQMDITVDSYNRAVAGETLDPFGKPLTRGAIPLVKPPFYAIRLWPKVHYTSGGVAINSKAQVMGLEKSPIPHLFAAGEVCGGIHGASRLGSCSLTECIVFGRIAGQQAAAMKPRSSD